MRPCHTSLSDGVWKQLGFDDACCRVPVWRGGICVGPEGLVFVAQCVSKAVQYLLLAHAPDLLDEFGSIGLYGEQGLEAWHGRYTQTARLYPGESDLASAASFVRPMALAGDARPAMIGRSAHKRSVIRQGGGALGDKGGGQAVTCKQAGGARPRRDAGESRERAGYVGR